MPELKEFYFDSSVPGQRIYTRMWIPEGAPRAAVQIAHGIAEYIERYDDFARFLAENGFIVVGNDHLGHGKSFTRLEDRGFFAEEGGWQRVVSDMHSLHMRIKAEYPVMPCIIFGHSMGSFLTRTYIVEYPNDFDAVILSGTGHQSKALIAGGLAAASLTAKRHGVRYCSKKLNDLAFGAYNKGFYPAPGETAWLSRDRELVAKYDSDPLCGFIPTCGLLRDMMGGLKFITDPKNISRMNLRTPVYFMSGAQDPVGEKGKGVERAYNSFIRAGVHDVFMRLYPGGRHEMLNEINKEDVYRDILDWLNSHMS